MTLQKSKPLRDRKYLNSFRDAACFVCGARDGTVVAAHIRSGHTGGIGLKPDDSLTLPLCAKCHAEQGANEKAFWQRRFGGAEVINQDIAVGWAKSYARRRYRAWRENNDT